MLDTLIRNGWVADGTGNPRYPADVAIQGDRIVEVGHLPDAQATRVIDATGKIVCPGFIDSHSHSNWSVLSNPTAESTIRQGVTTEITGHCGYSEAPVTDASRPQTEGRLRTYAYEGPISWSSFGEYLEVVRRSGTSQNLAWLVGHNTLRAATGVLGPQATEDQLQAMERMIRESMEAGVLGLSTGLEFDPGRVAPTEEIIRLAKVVGEYDGHYTSHIRNRDSQLHEALEEFIATVRASGVHGVVSHLNVRQNTGAPEGAWQRAVDRIEEVRREGLNILSDTIAYVEGLGTASGILPPWIQAEGPARAAELLRDPAVRARLRTDCDRYWRFIHRGEWHRVSMLTSAEFPEVAGKSFVEISQMWGKDPWDCYFDILAAAGVKMQSVITVGILYSEDHSAEMVSHPLFCLEADTCTSRIDGPLAQTTRHPLSYAGMVHFLTHHVREKKNLRLEDAIRKMSSMPANHFGLRDRGLIRPGFMADVVVFDFDKLEDGSTLAQPWVYARGVDHVFVNGVAVIDRGEHTGARPGRNLLR